MSWMTWLIWVAIAVFALPVLMFLGGFTYGIIEEICKTFSKKLPVPIQAMPQPIQAIPQPIQAIPQPISAEPFAPYNRIRGYFPSDN